MGGIGGMYSSTTRSKYELRYIDWILIFSVYCVFALVLRRKQYYYFTFFIYSENWIMSENCSKEESV